jgi:hypothetical protein
MRTSTGYKTLFTSERLDIKYNPMSLYLCGKSGVGKSYFVNEIASYFKKRLYEDGYGLIPDDALLYSRNSVDQYWSGYGDQFITYIDDMYQDRDAGDHQLICSIIGDPITHLTMADLSSKGKTFSSRVFIATSNQAYPEPTAIVKKEAIWRRRDLLIDVSVNTPYIGKPKHMVGHNDDYWVFRILHPTNASLQDKPLAVFTSKTELLEHMYKKFLERHYQKYVLSPEEHIFPVIRKDNRDFLLGTGAIFVPPGAVDGEDSWAIWPDGQYDSFTEILRAKNLSFHVIGDDDETTLCDIFSSKWSKSTFLERVMTTIKATPELISMIGSNMASFCSKHIDFIKFVGTLGGIALVSGLIKMIISWVWGKFFPKHEEQSDPSKKLTRPAQRLKATVIKPVSANVKTQAGDLLDPNAEQVISKVISNSYAIRNSESLKICGHGIFIQGQVFLTNKHTPKKMHGDKYEFVNDNNPNLVYTFDIKKSKLLEYEGNDLLVIIPNNKSIPSHQSLIKHIFSANDDLTHSEIQYGFFVKVVGKSNQVFSGAMRYLECFKAVGPGITESSTPVWQMNISTKAGDCGFPMFVILKNRQVRWCGIHTYGSINQPTGYSNALFRENFELDYMGLDEIQQPSYDEHLVVQQACEELQPTIHAIGSIDMPVFMPNKTSFEKSYFCDKLIPHLREPSILSHKESIERGTGEDPYRKALQKYVTNDVADDAFEYLSRATGEITCFLRGFPQYDLYARVLTEDETLNGTALNYMNHLDLTTSAGFPFKNGIVHKGKRDYFEIQDTGIVMTEKGAMVKEAWLNRIQKARERIRVESYWMDCLKDELLPPSKIKESKSRIFVAGPLDHTLATRQTCLGFVAHVMQNHVDNWCGPGLAESQLKWHILGKRLSMMDKFMCGDFSNWDKTLKSELIMAACDVINWWYSDGVPWRNVREVLFDEIAHTTVIGKDAVYMKVQGNPSGCALTTILNCIIQLLTFRMIWIRRMKQVDREDLVPFAQFVKHVFLCLYGDDNVMGITAEAAQYMDQQVLQREYKRFGITYTDPHKNENMPKFVEFEDIVFIKRKFVPFKGFYLGVKDLDDILDILSYIRKGPVEENTLMSIGAVVLELWKHGREVYDYWTSKIMEIWIQGQKEGVYTRSFEMPIYDDLIERWENKITNGENFTITLGDVESLGFGVDPLDFTS